MTTTAALDASSDAEALDALRTLIGAGELHGALALADRLLAHGENACVLATLGYLRQQSGEHQGAVEACERARSLGLNDWSNELMLAASLHALGRDPDGAQAARRAFRLAPGSPDAAALVLQTGALLQGVAEARAVVEAAASPSREAFLTAWPSTLSDYVARLIDAGELEQAAAACAPAIGVADSPMLHFQHGEILRRLGECEAAAAAYGRARAGGVEESGHYMLLGLGLREAGRHALAAAAFADVLRLELRSDAAVLQLEQSAAAHGLPATRETYIALRRVIASPDLTQKWRELQTDYIPSTVPDLLSAGRLDEAEAELRAVHRQAPTRRVSQWLHYLSRHREWLSFTSGERDRSDPSRRPSVGVYLVTYNHEKFIGAALEGVLNQVFDGEIEIHVVDDASTDATQAVVLDYQRRHPQIIKTFFNPINIGTLNPPQQKITYAAFQRLKSDYCCILEGDDYWSDPGKLQKQVDFLEKNPVFSCCSHNTLKIYDDGGKPPHRFLYWPGSRSTYTIDDAASMRMFFHTSSVLYRNLLMGKPPKGFASKWSCDIFNTTAHMQYGEMRYFDDDMSVYRQHAGGGYSNRSPLWGRIFNLEGLIRYNAWLGWRYVKDYAFSINRLSLALLRDAAAGELEPLNPAQSRRYRVIGWIAGTLYDLIDRHPALDPAVFLYKEPPKFPEPRTAKLADYDAQPS